MEEMRVIQMEDIRCAADESELDKRVRWKRAWAIQFRQ